MKHPFQWTQSDFVAGRQYAALLLLESEERGAKSISLNEEEIDE